jgi:hypothetical protein
MQSQSENAHIQLFKILDKYFILHFCFFDFVKAFKLWYFRPHMTYKFGRMYRTDISGLFHLKTLLIKTKTKEECI